MAAQLTGVLGGPVGQLGLAGRRCVDVEQVGHQAANLLARDHHVAHQPTQDHTGKIPEARRNTDYRPPLPEDPGQRPGQLAIGERFRPDRLDRAVLVALALLDRQPGQIIDVDRLQAILPVAEDREDRKPSQTPGDVVDQDIFRAEDHSRPEDRVR